MFIKDIKIGEPIEGFFVLSNAFSKQAANGKPFLSVVVEDCSGTIEGKVWDYSGPVSAADIGDIIKIRGNVSEFRGMPQLTIERIRLAEDSDQYNKADLVPAAPIDPEAAFVEIEGYVSSIEDADYAAVCRKMLELCGEQFKIIPAAKSVHHGFLNGLLMHTLFMLRTADHMAALYSAVIDRSLLLSGTLLHDFAKIKEFTLSPLGLVTDYSTKGNLLGHLVMGAQAVAKIAAELDIPEEKSVLLQHLILSHHGEPEYGAAVQPQCAESEMLSYIDMIDSRMEIYRETLQDVPAGEFSRRIFALDHHIYHHN